MDITLEFSIRARQCVEGAATGETIRHLGRGDCHNYCGHWLTPEESRAAGLSSRLSVGTHEPNGWTALLLWSEAHHLQDLYFCKLECCIKMAYLRP